MSSRYCNIVLAAAAQVRVRRDAPTAPSPGIEHDRRDHGNSSDIANHGHNSAVPMSGNIFICRALHCTGSRRPEKLPPGRDSPEFSASLSRNNRGRAVEQTRGARRTAPPAGRVSVLLSPTGCFFALQAPGSRTGRISASGRRRRYSRPGESSRCRHSRGCRRRPASPTRWTGSSTSRSRPTVR